MIDEDDKRAAQRRSDRFLGTGLLIVGLFATITNMSVFTENALAGQMALFYKDFGLSEYVRPAGLASLSLAATITIPAVYALTLYLTLIRWRAGKRAAWIPILGAIVTFIAMFVILAVVVVMHPELLAAASSGATPTPRP